jgi:hypothetical protein
MPRLARDTFFIGTAMTQIFLSLPMLAADYRAPQEALTKTNRRATNDPDHKSAQNTHFAARRKV